MDEAVGVTHFSPVGVWCAVLFEVGEATLVLSVRDARDEKTE